MNKLNLYDKCLTTIVIINNGRLDDMTLGQLYKIVNYLLTKDFYTAFEFAKNLTESTIRADDIAYISDIISDLVKIEAE